MTRAAYLVDGIRSPFGRYGGGLGGVRADDLAGAERYFSLAEEVCARHGLDPGALVVLPFLD